MLTDEELAYLAQPIINIFNDLEIELILDIAKRFDTYDKIGGTLEWRLKKLEELGALNKSTIKIIASHSTKTEKAITKMLKEASMANFDKVLIDEAFKKNKLKMSYTKAMNSDLIAKCIKDSNVTISQSIKMIQTSARESVKQAYMDVLNKAYIETSSGIYSYSESITRAMKEMAKQGITGATYERTDAETGEKKVIRYSIEGVIRRDVVTAANSVANRASIELAESMGYENVEVSQHIGARYSEKSKIANHAGWQGKVYKIIGNDEHYKNLAEETGYGEIIGLGGINCRHRTFPFIVGVSTPQGQLYEFEENRKRRDILDKQRSMERRIRHWRKQKLVADQIGNEKYKKYCSVKIDDLNKQLDSFCDRNKLRRETLREVIATNGQRK